MKRLFALFAESWKDFMKYNCQYIASAIAYWGLLSLFPLALAGVSLAGFIYTGTEERQEVVERIASLAPVSREYVAQTLSDVARARGPLGILATAGLLWSGMGVFSAVRKGINHAWRIGQMPSFAIERAIDFAMLAGIAGIVLAQGVVANALGLPFFAWAVEQAGGSWLTRLMLDLFALMATFVGFVLLYRFVPNTKVAWRDVWLGAAFGAVLFQAVRIGFGLALARAGDFNLVYGALGALAAVMIWAYMASMALLWGAQLSSTYNLMYGSGRSTEAAMLLRPVPGAEKNQSFLYLPILFIKRLRERGGRP